MHAADNDRHAGGEDELTMTLLMRAAERYGMRTESTDWSAVARAAGMARRATATLGPAAGDRPLRTVPPE